MLRRLADVRARGLPYLVAEDRPGSGAVLGFAYAGPYRARPAYRYALEDSVYVLPGGRGRGIRSSLLGALIERCTALGYRQLIPVIGDSANAGPIPLPAHSETRRGGHESGSICRIRWSPIQSKHKINNITLYPLSNLV